MSKIRQVQVILTLTQNKCRHKSDVVCGPHFQLMRVTTEDLTLWVRLPPLGEACHRKLEAATWAFVLTYYRHTGSATLYSHLLNNFSFSLYKKTTKSWLIISNPFHPIMIQWIIYFPQLNHSRSHFLSYRQNPVYFTHGSQLVFIETFKMHLNTEGFKKSCFISLSQFCHGTILSSCVQNVSFWRQRNVSMLWLCFVTGQGGFGFSFVVDVSFEYIYNFFSFSHLHVQLCTHVSYFSPERFQQIKGT